MNVDGVWNVGIYQPKKKNCRSLSSDLCQIRLLKNCSCVWSKISLTFESGCNKHSVMMPPGDLKMSVSVELKLKSIHHKILKYMYAFNWQIQISEAFQKHEHSRKCFKHRVFWECFLFWNPLMIFETPQSELEICHCLQLWYCIPNSCYFRREGVNKLLRVSF